MQPENYINVVEKLNSELESYCDNINVLGISFEYSTTCYVDMINFMGFCIWCNDIDESIETEEELEKAIKDKVLSFNNDLYRWLNKISD